MPRDLLLGQAGLHLQACLVWLKEDPLEFGHSHAPPQASPLWAAVCSSVSGETAAPPS